MDKVTGQSSLCLPTNLCSDDKSYLDYVRCIETPSMCHLALGNGRSQLIWGQKVKGQGHVMICYKFGDGNSSQNQ